MLMREKTDVGVAVASLERGAGFYSCIHVQHIGGLVAVSESEISAVFLDAVIGIVFLMKKTIQPLLNWNVHGRRRRLHIYSFKGNIWMLLKSKKLTRNRAQTALLRVEKRLMEGFEKIICRFYLCERILQSRPHVRR